ncbi:MAG TPA: holo-ACP synthase [bacterium]|uniref:Holo-[acyl-carrier-protein] synthase n=1 Tax=candidate division TA06 bacterium ADurb.Bin417 TaxID=1852828 RepID=A0A1V5MKF0_UNCT6|nr:MAG: Holo-(acyl-carrier-protein) synthase [candidate division TA06 bacterium ADurb.Bin417]HNQ34543.1 holo-ACP synthase [bacterium]HNS49022.1 holo-ACP synthase [bacterium]
MIRGIGIDIISVEKVARALSRQARFRNRVFTPPEQALCEQRPSPATHYAGKFAAKEAFLKALGREERRGIGWRDIEVLNTPGGQPYYRISGPAGAALAEAGGKVLLSLSHSDGFAVAFCLIEK